MILEADCLDAMRDMDEASVDAIVTDPPYGLEFMGKEWDRLAMAGRVENTQSVRPRTAGYVDNDPRKMQQWHEAWATEALRVLRPGGHLLAFGGTRTYHRLACAIEDAGFEIRDSVIWLYGSGFPKSLDVSKAIDKAEGAEREVVGQRKNLNRTKNRGEAAAFNASHGGMMREDRDMFDDCPNPATPEAQQWQGWGTALKPAHEPIVLARKPLIGTVAQNVSEHGTGALNVDGCRIGATVETWPTSRSYTESGADFDNGEKASEQFTQATGEAPSGRWPANVALSHLPECERVGTRRVKASQLDQTIERSKSASESIGAQTDGHCEGYADPDGTEQVEAWRCVEGCPVAELDRQSGDIKGGAGGIRLRAASTDLGVMNDDGWQPKAIEQPSYADRGGCSRFFYTAKASRAERNAGLDGFEEAKPHDNAGHVHADGRAWDIPGSHSTARANHHPTVKPIDLMRWLVRLVTPPNGTILDPFCGSGTTGIAATLEGFSFIGIEREAEYAEIAKARIAWWERHPEGMELVKRLNAEAERKAIIDSGQGSLFDVTPVDRANREGEASRERTYTDNGASNFAMKPGRRR